MLKYCYAILADGDWVDHYECDKILTQREKEQITSSWNKLRLGQCEMVRVQTAADMRH